MGDGNARHISDSGYSSDDPFEREADAFAAALLMPPKPFKATCAHVAPGFKTIETIHDANGKIIATAGMDFKPKPNQSDARVTERSGQIDNELETKLKSKEKLFESVS